MRFGSLFAGIGGFDLGFERAGMECAWQVEIDDKARAVLEARFPHRDRSITDVRDANRDTLAPVDLVCGGFPCQDISLARRTQDGLAGERSGLWFEFRRIICQLQPRWVVIENVRNLLSIDDGGAMATVLWGLSECGYDAEWEVIPAYAVGAPHRRDRVWVVAYPKGRLGDDRLFQWGDSREIDFWKQTTPQWGAYRQESSVGAETLWGLAYQWKDGNHPSEVLRVVDGIPGQLDRLRQLGNAIVPQIAEWIGRRIVQVEQSLSAHR